MQSRQESNSVKIGNSLRIAYLVQHGVQLNNHSGGIIHVRAIIRYLQQAGHFVTFLSPGKSIWDVIFSDDLVTTHNIPLSLSGTKLFKLFERGVRRVQQMARLPYLALFDSLRFYEACVNKLKDYEVFHERFSMGLGGIIAAQRLGKPLVLEVNADFLKEWDSIGQGPHGLQRLVMQWASALCFNQAKLIIVVSNQLKTHLVQTWNLPEEKIIVLPNGADVDSFCPDIEPQIMRAQLGLPESPMVIFVSSFYPWHAPLELIDSFAVVHQQIPTARFYLVGDGPMRRQAETKIQQLKLCDNVIFTGVIPHEQIPAWLGAADVAVAPYINMNKEMWFSPLKLFEYMAAGKAIVSSRVGQVGEVIHNGYNGVLVEPGDVVRFGDAITALLKDPLERKRLGANAQQQAIERHSWTQYAKKLEEIYLRALSTDLAE